MVEEAEKERKIELVSEYLKEIVLLYLDVFEKGKDISERTLGKMRDEGLDMMSEEFMDLAHVAGMRINFDDKEEKVYTIMLMIIPSLLFGELSMLPISDLLE